LHRQSPLSRGAQKRQKAPSLNCGLTVFLGKEIIYEYFEVKK